MKLSARTIGLIFATPLLLAAQERGLSPIDNLQDLRSAIIQGEYRRAYDLSGQESLWNAAWSNDVLMHRETIARELQLATDSYAAMTELSETPIDGDVPREAWLLRGLRGLKSGDKGWARTCFNRAIVETDLRDQINSDALYWIGVSHADGQSARDMREAVAALTACAEQQPNGNKADDALYLLGEINERADNIPAALAAYQHLVANYSNSPLYMDAQLRVANCNLRRGDYSTALAGLESAHQAAVTRSGDVSLLKGYALLGLGRYPEAEQAFIPVVYGQDSTNMRRATMGLADTYLNAGRADSAFTIYRRLAGTGNDRIALQARFKEGSALLRAGQTEAGQALLTEIAADSTNENHERALLELATLRYSQGNYNQVIEETGGISRSRVERIATEASLLRGLAFMALKDYTRAAASFAEAQRSDEETSSRSQLAARRNDIALLRGISLTLDRRNADAIALLDNLVTSQTGYDQIDRAGYWLGEAYYQAGMMAASAQTMEWVIEKHPTSPLVPDALHTTGWAYLKLGRLVRSEAAFANLVKAYPLTPHLVDAETRRGDCLYRLGHYNEAIAAYKRARTNDTTGPTEYTDYQIALAHFRMQDFPAASTELEKFIEKYPASELSDDALYLAGTTSIAEKKYSRSIDEMYQLLQHHPQSELIAGAYQNIATASALLENYADAYAGFTIVADRFQNSRYAAEAREMKKRIAKLLEEDDEDRDVTLRTAAIFMAAGDVDRARQTYEKAVTSGENEIVRWKGLLGITRTYIQSGDTAAAIETLSRFDEQNLRGNPRPETMLALAQAYVEIARNEEALNTLKALRTSWPEAIETARGTLVEANLYLDARETATAKELLEQNAARFDTKDEGAQSLLALASIRSAAGETDSARATLQKVAERTDTIGAEALLRIGEMDQQAGAHLEASKTFEALALRFQSNRRWKRRAQLGMARSYEQLGEREKAKQLYQDIVSTTDRDDIGQQAAERLRGIGTL